MKKQLTFRDVPFLRLSVVELLSDYIGLLLRNWLPVESFLVLYTFDTATFIGLG